MLVFGRVPWELCRSATDSAAPRMIVFTCMFTPTSNGAKSPFGPGGFSPLNLLIGRPWNILQGAKLLFFKDDPRIWAKTRQS